MNKRNQNISPEQNNVKDFKGSIIKLIKYIKPYYKYFIIAIILGFISSICMIIGPNKLKELVNIITIGMLTKIDLDSVKNLVIFLGIIYIVSAIFSYIQNYIMVDVTSRLSYKLRNEISKKINKLPLKYFDNNSIGDILSRVTNDVDTISNTLTNSVCALLFSITLFIGVIIMMFTTNVYMAITTIISSLIGFVFLTIILKKSQKYFEIGQKELGNINGHIEEIYSSLNVVKVYNGVDDSNKKFDKINEKLYESVKKSNFLSGLMPPIMGFIGNFGYVCVCIVGALLVINNKTDIGTIVAFMLYTRLFTSPLTNIAQSLSQLQSTAAASERVFEFLDEKEMNNEKNLVKKIENIKGNIDFEHVRFGYNIDKEIIKDFSASIKKGSKIAIVGPTGAGKTTIVNLLMKFYDINSGDILIDDVSIKELSRENIHDLFIMVLQDTWIYNGTIKENIIYNQKHITDDMVYKACKTVGLDYFINTLPDGYDTILTDADSISSGQKQLLTIARGILKNSPFLILDEATSSVDTRTEQLVNNAMNELTKGRTSFIIAHRLSTIKNADLILVMKDGNIIEQGNHKELLNKNGFYAELYNSQFKN